MKTAKVSYELALPDEAKVAESSTTPGYRFISMGVPFPLYIPPGGHVEFVRDFEEGYYVGAVEGFAWKLEAGLWYTWSSYPIAAWRLYDGGFADEPGHFGPVEDDWDPSMFEYLGPLKRED